MNFTIDDSQWSTPALTLSPGWNMLTNDSAYFVSESQVEQMRPHLGGFFNASYSWNTDAGCSNTLTFIGMSPPFTLGPSGAWPHVVGTSVRVYGLSGPDCGNYSVELDGDRSQWSAFRPEKTDYAHLLFMVDGLAEEMNHTLTFTNLEDKWFGFDYAQISSEIETESEDEPEPEPEQEEQQPVAAVNDPPLTNTNTTTPAPALVPGTMSPDQLALLTPYHPHWTAGALFCVVIAAISLSCLYIFFLFQIGDMLRGQHAGVPPTPAPMIPMSKRQKRASWISGRDRDRPASRVLHALQTKKISAPSPIPEDDEKSFGGKSPMSFISASASNEAGSSNTSHDRYPPPALAPPIDTEGEGMKSPPITPSDPRFPRLSYKSTKSPKSPRMPWSP